MNEGVHLCVMNDCDAPAVVRVQWRTGRPAAFGDPLEPVWHDVVNGDGLIGSCPSHSQQVLAYAAGAIQDLLGGAPVVRAVPYDHPVTEPTPVDESAETGDQSAQPATPATTEAAGTSDELEQPTLPDA